MMTCIITRQDMKRRTRNHPGPSGVYRSVRRAAAEPGAKDAPIAGDEIQRDLKSRWRISVCEHLKENGRSFRRTCYLCTITYWDIVDDVYSREKKGGLFRHAWRRLETLLPDGDGPELKRLVMERMRPVREDVLKDYQASEEYYYRLIQDLVTAKKKESDDRKSKRNTEHAGCENPNGDKKKEEKQDPPGSENADGPKFTISELLKAEDGEARSIALEIIQAGYKKIAVKYHPDVGGDTLRMQTLNQVKDRLLRLSNHLF